MDVVKIPASGETPAHTCICDGDKVVGRVYADDAEIHEAQVAAVVASGSIPETI